MTKVFGKAVWGAFVALALCVPVDAASSSGKGSGSASAKLDQALRDKGNRGSSNDLQAVIVTVKGSAKAGVRKRLAAHGGRLLKDHGIVNALTVRVDAQGLDALVSDPDVERISIDAEMTALGHKFPQPVLSSIRKTLALANPFVGSSLTVAVIDSGIAETMDFSARIVGTYDFTNGQSAVARSAIDEYGHGTHVAGLAGSSGVISDGVYAGVAPGVKFLSLRVLDKKGTGKTSDVIAALEFAVANRARFNIRVINLSLGHPIYESATTDPLVQAIESAVRAGLVVVVAAGNYGTNPLNGRAGYAGITSPGNAPSAITVGAASGAHTLKRTDDRVAAFSSRGPSWYDGYGKPDVVAPGEGLMSDGVDGSTLATSYPALLFPRTNGKLMKLSGSSMATAVVSGLVAVMIEAHDVGAQQRHNSSGRLKKFGPHVPPPPLTPNAIKAMLQYSATPLRDAAGVKYDALTQGAGEVDGFGAVTLAYSANTASEPGAAWMSPVFEQTWFGLDVQAWSQQIVWGTQVVSGAGLMEVNQAAWSASVTWGSGELDNIVWGTVTENDNIVWGAAALLGDVSWSGSVLEGDNIVWGTLHDWGPNIVWGAALIGELEGDNIVWGTLDGELDNIVWGTLELDNIVWGTTWKRVVSFVLFGGAL